MDQAADQDASEIAKALLDRTGAALMSGNFACFRTAFHLPYRVETFEATRVFESDAELQHAFDLMCGQLLALNVTDMARRIAAADFITPRQIGSTHISELLSGDRRVIEPYPVYSILEVVDGRWRILKSDYALKPKSGLEQALLRPLSRSNTTQQHPKYNPMAQVLKTMPPNCGDDT